MHADQLLDASGLTCPEPLMLTRNKIRELNTGDVLKVVATDPTTVRDLEQFCRFMGHRLIAYANADDAFQFWIEKAGG